MKLKLHYIYFTVLLLFSSCTNNKPSTPQSDVRLSIELVSKTDSAFRYQRIYWDTIENSTYPIKVTITNKSDSGAAFWMMNCSWWENIITSNNCIHISETPCFKNSPSVFRLKKGETLERYAYLVKNKEAYSKIDETRLGLIFIDTTICSGMNVYDTIIGDKSKYDRIIWSNSLMLNR